MLYNYIRFIFFIYICNCYAMDVTGAGASFPLPLYSAWAAEYALKFSDLINYQAIGSAAGVKQIKNRNVVFAATDRPLTINELQQYGLVQWPQIIGAVSLIANIPGIDINNLLINGDILSNIFLRKIKYWDDDQLKVINKHLNLPHIPIVIIYRSDGSGTSFILSKFLSDYSQDFKNLIGATSLLKIHNGIGVKGSENMASLVNKLVGSVGYLEYSYIKQANITSIKMFDRCGNIVKDNDLIRSSEYFTANNLSNICYIWPIIGASYILFPIKPNDHDAAVAALSFFKWAMFNGGDMAINLGYAELPINERMKLINYILPQIEVRHVK